MKSLFATCPLHPPLSNLFIRVLFLPLPKGPHNAIVCAPLSRPSLAAHFCQDKKSLSRLHFHPLLLIFFPETYSLRSHSILSHLSPGSHSMNKPLLQRWLNLGCTNLMFHKQTYVQSFYTLPDSCRIRFWFC